MSQAWLTKCRKRLSNGVWVVGEDACKHDKATHREQHAHVDDLTHGAEFTGSHKGVHGGKVAPNGEERKSEERHDGRHGTGLLDDGTQSRTRRHQEVD